MFKVFLHRRLHGKSSVAAGKESEKPTSNDSLQNADSKYNQRTNRRHAERFAVDAKQLAIFSDQDILFIRDLSNEGFSSCVSDRAFDRFIIGDQYASRLSHLGKSYELHIEVTWKNENMVGFKFKKLTPESSKLISRLIKPAQIASSLIRVDAAFVEENRIWYHGDDQTDLLIWQPYRDGIDGWELTSGSIFVIWDPEHQYRTGKIEASQISDTGLIPGEQTLKVFDKIPNQETIKFALDIIMGSACQEKEQLGASIGAT